MCDSVTYHPSSDKCTGNQLREKCAESGRRGARINDSESHDEVQKAIKDNKEYWTGLR